MSRTVSPGRNIESVKKVVDEKTVCYDVAEPFLNVEHEKKFIMNGLEYCKLLMSDELARNLLHQYKSGKFKVINDYLRNPSLKQEWSWGKYYYFDHLINNAPTYDYSIFAYRGVGLNYGIGLNDVLQDNAYKSASLRSTQCFAFRYGAKKSIFLQIKIPAGLPVLFLDICGKSESYDYRINRGDEAEILLGRDVHFSTFKPSKTIAKEYQKFLKSNDLIFFVYVVAVVD